ncbi:hypothetical protein K4F52_008637 [Lecanicillium sp. MT-2017a]|nr:hypothetical protein K4F52_008637 [Lecanicillium sp. MT-2017a]
MAQSGTNNTPPSNGVSTNTSGTDQTQNVSTSFSSIEVGVAQADSSSSPVTISQTEMDHRNELRETPTQNWVEDQSSHLRRRTAHPYQGRS